jgi:hypothetical protein
VRLIGAQMLPEPETFDPAHSAALFVGVRDFDADIPLVRYAVDDAVDLAYAFSIARRSALVPPARVVLALSGRPAKEDSRQRLRELEQAGATIASPTAEEIVTLLERQRKQVTGAGILIVSFATHGFLDEGEHYLLGKSSTFDPDTALRASRVLDEAALAVRSLVLVDACRDRMPDSSRAADNGPDSTAPLVTRMSRSNGQVVLYAAPHGEYAFDDDREMNGVFTKAVLDALACKARNNILTAEELFKYANKRVQAWVKTNRPGSGKGGVQVNMGPNVSKMPLAYCACGTVPPPSDTWRATLRDAVAQSEIADLDGDCASETIVNAAGALHVFESNGAPRWSGGAAIEKFSIGEGRNTRKDILALSANGFSLFDDAGKVRATVRGTFDDVRLYRPNSRYEPRIVAISGDTIALFTANNPLPAWRKRVERAIDDLDFVDADKDKKLDLSLRTAEGPFVLDVDGHCLNGRKVTPLPRK